MNFIFSYEIRESVRWDGSPSCIQKLKHEPDHVDDQVDQANHYKQTIVIKKYHLIFQEFPSVTLFVYQ